ncbi:Transposon Tn7 transposition protein TnsA [Paraburkholderia ribeironis]|uniref:Transposon Tn7 transposition protein TnsA n=1 Tax=Paraburkholderia ribeironis TaxID=1247936 RepID=A0A1N7SPV7_9BURK|nr:TnsA endonuclease N-terminal domain-containing protein [Paraburkholderia ribeironis]SIT49360.1 Transposon Tn7 transposition protein TnsA [Paraburkholderia ribeironis]
MSLYVMSAAPSRKDDWRAWDMSRGIQNWTEELIARRIREGYGDGEGPNYKPWISTATFSSRGRIHRAYSERFGRTIELVSDVEWNTFVLLEWCRSVKQLYESFPLPRETTLEIASALGIRHPYYPGTNIPAVMTVDMMVIMEIDGETRHVAYDCKRTEDAEKEWVIEKLQIVRKFFAGCDIAHHLVFHSALPMQKVRNIEYFRGAIWKPGQIEPTREVLREVADLMTYELTGSTRTISLADYCSGFEQRHGLTPGLGLRVARILLWEQTLRCDLNTPRLENAPLSSFICEGPALSRASGL